MSLAKFLDQKNAAKKQVERFLATAEWLTIRGTAKMSTGDVTKALKDSHLPRLANPSDCLNKNVSKGYCEKDGRKFFVTPRRPKSWVIMIAPSHALATIPTGLRNPLLNEHRMIVQNYLKRKWLPSELSGGRFCEIVYTILDGHASGSYATAPSKPRNFPQACRSLENNSGVPRSFQILIPRMLPPLYEIRNNRGVGHVGGDVDPNYMDSTAVLGMVNWVMAELVRVFHSLSTTDAQQVVTQLVERRIPIIWQIGDIKRVLDTTLKLPDQTLLLIASCPAVCDTDELFTWLDYKNRGYFNKLLRDLHAKRMIELSSDSTSAQILPPGAKHVEEKLMPKYV